jgi:hypothetical protein
MNDPIHNSFEPTQLIGITRKIQEKKDEDKGTTRKRCTISDVRIERKIRSTTQKQLEWRKLSSKAAGLREVTADLMASMFCLLIWRERAAETGCAHVAMLQP